MATVDPVKLNIILAKDSAGALRRFATVRARQVFNDAVIGMQREFEDSKVTQEIDGGVSAANESETLLGGDGPQNLTAFIGFEEGTHPTEEIRKRLSPSDPNGPKIGQGRNVSVPGRAPTFQFDIDVARTEKAIYSHTPLPWAEDISWAEGIEHGIRGFAQFLDRFMESKRSRSGGGIQIQEPNEVRAATFKPTGYLTPIFEHFAQRVKDYARGGLRTRFTNPNTRLPQEPL